MSKKLRGILIVFFLLIFALCCYKLVLYFSESAANNKAVAEAKKEITEFKETQEIPPEDEESEARIPDQNLQDDDNTEEDPGYIPKTNKAVDFGVIKEKNPDIIGWITIDGTRIDYPICHSMDDSFYLTHNFMKEKNSNGSIFIESINQPDFSDFNTVIYGHAMLNGSMFNNLHKFKNNSFFNSHDTVLIYIEDKILKYKIFARQVLGDTHIFAGLDNSDIESRKSYLENIFNSPDSHIREGVSVDENSKIITLSTCMTDRSKRLVIYAVLTD